MDSCGCSSCNGSDWFSSFFHLSAVQLPFSLFVSCWFYFKLAWMQSSLTKPRNGVSTFHCIYCWDVGQDTAGQQNTPVRHMFQYFCSQDKWSWSHKIDFLGGIISNATHRKEVAMLISYITFIKWLTHFFSPVFSKSQEIGLTVLETLGRKWTINAEWDTYSWTQDT